MSIDYIIVPSSKCLYQKWQLELLNWSRKKVDQKGKLIVLLSDDINHENEKVTLDLDDNVEVINLPDWAKQWEIDNKEWWGGIPNKYESVNWLVENYNFNNSDTLLFLDPDMIFTEAIDISVYDNQVIGQDWYGYVSKNKNLENDLYSIMYPFVINFKTLKTIADDYRKECIRFRKETGAWESEMYGLDAAIKANNLEIFNLRNFGNCTLWNTNTSNTESSLIHFPNPIVDKFDNKIFFKQDYTFDKNQIIDINKARNLTDKNLLIAVDEQRTDYIYFSKWNYDNILTSYDGSNGNLIFEPWPGGFNNIRMSFELAYCLAYLTNRVLVLPPTYNMYLCSGDNNLDDFFEINNLGIKYLSFTEFCNKEDIEVDYNNVERISKILDYDSVSNVVNFETVPVPSNFLKGRKELKSKDLFDDSRNIFLKRNLLGSFYQSIFTSKDNELKQLVSKYIRYRTDLLDKAWEFINILGDKKYYSVHIRRNDFQYKDLFVSPETVFENIKKVVPFGSILYIATDHKDKEYFNIFHKNYKVYFYNDLYEQIYKSDIPVDWIPIIEQLICARSLKFIGNKLSTLSSYIFRLRGYMSDIEDKNYYLNTEDTTNQQIFFKEDNSFIANWAREYKDSWTYDTSRILVSIASYRDSQITETILDLFDNVSDKDRVRVVVHLQDTKEQYQELKNLNLKNLDIIFTPYEKSKGVVWARNRIWEKHSNEEYILCVDSHTRFKKNWNLILINNYNSIEKPKVIISTYPNHFDYPDPEKNYLNLKYNTPLRIRRFLSIESKTDNRFVAENLPSLEDYKVEETRWVGAGFFFTRSEWLKEVKIPDEIKFNGEEDHLTLLSYLKGWNLYVTPEAVVWHNYNFKNSYTDEPYRIHNSNIKIEDKSSEHVNNFLFNQKHQRNLLDLEKYFNIKLRRL